LLQHAPVEREENCVQIRLTIFIEASLLKSGDQETTENPDRDVCLRARPSLLLAMIQ
jgi:hypothetical protein